MLKVGDRIMCTVSTISTNVGKVGTVFSVYNSFHSYPYKIKFEDSAHAWWGDGYLATDLVKALV
jgi:hypothetical protein